MNSLKFEGKGFEFFKIHFMNVIFTILSLSFLYPWAKIREFKYLCQNTFLAENPFTFTGNVGVFFKGYLKTMLVCIFVIAFCIGGGVLTAVLKDSMFSMIVYTSTFVMAIAFTYYFIPIVLHGSLNYRLDNASWGDVKLSYVGKLSELAPLYFSGSVLTTLTAGIYNAWFQVKISRYLLQNIRCGSLRFDFNGDSKKLFLIYLKGTLLTLITFGIYGIWFTKQLYEYSVNHIVVKKDDHEFKLHSNANILEVFEMVVGNILLVCLTLGIGASWAYMRYYRFIIDHCVIPADFNINSICDSTNEFEALENTDISNRNWLDKWNPIFIA